MLNQGTYPATERKISAMDDANEQYPLDADGEDVGAGDDSSSSEIDKTVPETRFKEVYGKMKELEREIGTLRDTKKEGNLTENQSKELQAKEYLKGLLKETLEEEKRASESKEQAELAKFKEDVNSVLEIHTDVKRDDFLKFIEEEGDDYASIAAAMKGYKRLHETAKDASEKAKQNLSKKPGLPRSEGSGGEKTNYADSDKGKTLWQIAQEAAAGISKK